jgi:hypothetical protein
MWPITRNCISHSQNFVSCFSKFYNTKRTDATNLFGTRSTHTQLIVSILTNCHYLLRHAFLVVANSSSPSCTRRYVCRKIMSWDRTCRHIACTRTSAAHLVLLWSVVTLTWKGYWVNYKGEMPRKRICMRPSAILWWSQILWPSYFIDSA